MIQLKSSNYFSAVWFETYLWVGWESGCHLRSSEALSKFVSSLIILVPLWQQIINTGCSVKLYILQRWVCQRGVCQRGEIRDHVSLNWTYMIVGDGNLCFASQTMILCYVLCSGSTQQLAANNCCTQQVLSQVDVNWKFPTSPLGDKWASKLWVGLLLISSVFLGAHNYLSPWSSMSLL
jgi:hypothetical protein